MTNILNNLFICFIGFSAGIGIAAAVVAFITLVGVVTKVVNTSKTNQYIKLYEDIIIIGGLSGCLLSIYEFQIHVGIVVAVICALFIGMFVGSLAISLAESLSAVPIFARRVKLKKELPIIIICIAVGKCIGAIMQFVYMR